MSFVGTSDVHDHPSSDEEPEYNSDDILVMKGGTRKRKRVTTTKAPSFVGSYGDHDYPSSEEEPEYDSDYALAMKGGTRKRNRAATTKRKPRAPPKPTYVARVTETATDPAAVGASKVESADSSVIARIRKALKLAMHAGTGEAEAKLAMRMATKLMQAHNLTQADIIANETAEERSTRAGRSVVTITSTAGKINTVGASFAFEMLHNQIETWAIERKKELKGRTAGNSYRNGAAQRVWNDAVDEKKKALKQAEADEKKRLQEEAAAAEAARTAEIARLAMPNLSNERPVAEEKPTVVKIEDVPEEHRKTLANPSGMPFFVLFADS
ncbi:hypothetical protein DXG03_004227 [Asterophora parasitica]|uniref:DUF2786 domain-containing protein n=1 Tax=Asterophora parasitica TaxID=117018 RepID=A0A9P7GAX0_9AGAR|nr:hypothetical protein DXG03_004227 [Asterophora parasitica]